MLKRSCFYIFTIFCFTSCMNKYERKLIGDYSVVNNDTALNDSVVFKSKLNLKADKSFTMIFNSKKITGSWNADDYGDFTLVNFNFDGNTWNERILGNMEDDVEIEVSIFAPQYKLITYKKM